MSAATAVDYRVCTRCVMDTSDPEITFDADGVCGHCRLYDERVAARVRTGEAGRRELAEIAEAAKRDGRGRDYDCVIGVSGGVDSTFVAWKVKELGLRPLAVHLDNGWDSELAVMNIQRALDRLSIHLDTLVLDWEEFRDLQLAFLKASTPDSEIPTDHAIFALLRRTAARIGVKHVISGRNVRTESHAPRAWSQGHGDWRYIKAVHDRFGTVRLRTYPHLGLAGYAWYASRQRFVDLLDYVDYVKSDALAVLEKELGWRNYGGKHHESIYTRFFQGHILPRKFGFDKRRGHLSSLVCSGETTREAALLELATEAYPVELQMQDREYVAKKLGLTESEFDAVMKLPVKTYWDYPSYGRLFESKAFRALVGLGRRVNPQAGV